MPTYFVLCVDEDPEMTDLIYVKKRIVDDYTLKHYIPSIFLFHS